MKLRTVIIDDEIASIETIKILATKHAEFIEIVAYAQDIETGVALIKETQADLVFLDIELADGTGFEIVERTKEIDYQLVFVTAYNQYALAAFKANAQNYILKPILKEDLDKVLEQVILNHFKFNQHLYGILTLIENNEYKIYHTENLIRLQGDSNYTKLYFKDEKEKISSKTLKQFELKLNPLHFIRIHNSHIVNLQFITKYKKGDGGEIELKNGETLPVSRTQKAKLLRLIQLK